MTIESNKAQTGSKKVTKAQIQEWKKEHKTVHEIRVKVSEDDEAVGYLKSPDRNIIARAAQLHAQDKLIEVGEFLIANCWLGGDMRIREDEDVAVSAAIFTSGNLVEFKETQIKKL